MVESPVLGAINLRLPYIKGDIISLLLAPTAIVPYCIIIALFGCFFYHRTFESFSILVGVIIQQLLNIVMKVIFRIPRPIKTIFATEKETIEDYIHVLYWPQYGMPSSHTQFMFYFWIMAWVKLPLAKSLSIQNFWEIMYFLAAVYVGWGRVHQEEHTVGQVIVGGVSGAIYGYIYISFQDYMYNMIMDGPYKFIKEWLQLTRYRTPTLEKYD